MFIYEEDCVMRILLYYIIVCTRPTLNHNFFEKNDFNIIIIPTDRPSRKIFLLVHLKIKLASPKAKDISIIYSMELIMILNILHFQNGDSKLVSLHSY